MRALEVVHSCDDGKFRRDFLVHLRRLIRGVRGVLLEPFESMESRRGRVPTRGPEKREMAEERRRRGELFLELLLGEGVRLGCFGNTGEGFLSPSPNAPPNASSSSLSGIFLKEE